VKLNYATLIAASIAMVFFFHHAFQSPWTGARILGLFIAISSFLLLVLARIQLGQAFSVSARASVLVCGGLYSRIRNPIYVFSTLLFVGIVLMSERPWWLLFLAVLIPVQVFRSHRESRVLEEKFGDAYLQYRRKTWF